MPKNVNKERRYRVWLLLRPDEMYQVELQTKANECTKEALLSAYVREGLGRVQRLGIMPVKG